MISRDMEGENLANKTIFHVFVRCHNGMGLSSTIVTDGVRIVTQPPATDTAVVQFLPLSSTQYPVSGRYQSDVTKLRITWSGFKDSAGIDSYQVHLGIIVHNSVLYTLFK